MDALKFYSLSTCSWCRKTRNYLKENKIKHREIIVDTLSPQEKAKALEDIAKVNPAKSFPTLIMNKNHFVVGYKPDQLREVFKK
ncbi:glutaredoxin family protein [bacterium]|nr:glutaredoxin family protein [bacterium]